MSKRIVIRRGAVAVKPPIHPDTPRKFPEHLVALHKLKVGQRFMHGKVVYFKAAEEAMVEVLPPPVNMNHRLSSPAYYLPIRGDTLVLVL